MKFTIFTTKVIELNEGLLEFLYQIYLGNELQYWTDSKEGKKLNELCELGLLSSVSDRFFITVNARKVLEQAQKI